MKADRQAAMLHRLEAQSQAAALAALDRIVAALYRCGDSGDIGPTGEDTVLEPWMTVSVSPELVSNRDMLTAREQGAGGVPVDTEEVRVTTARTSVRLLELVAPEFPKGSVALVTAPAPSFVIAVELPMVAPLEFKNEIDPVHEAAVPLLALEARFTTSTSSVWVDPTPTTGRFMEEVTVSVVVVCAHPKVAVTTKKENTIGFIISSPLENALSMESLEDAYTIFGRVDGFEGLHSGGALEVLNVRASSGAIYRTDCQSSDPPPCATKG
jgi:hypothetical protein